jgi:hypothetical protein
MTLITDLEDPVSPDGSDVFTPPGRPHWRRWLAANHGRPVGLWVVYRKKAGSLEGPVYDDLVEEALCFGVDRQPGPPS